ncbi:hypothetical protein ADU59_10775 [Pararhizobium polonicum]|uniref:Uncharacterized protein n=1 Tax=Pararhizobium polonicum TaxID=1612624 RepID=A0A1C7P3G6_9HYPH|nr:hypothetical protein ADU59_10775 [Pararhizobium polonicum]
MIVPDHPKDVHWRCVGFSTKQRFCLLQGADTFHIALSTLDNSDRVKLEFRRPSVRESLNAKLLIDKNNTSIRATVKAPRSAPDCCS